MGAIEFVQVTAGDLEKYRMLILPAIYDELSASESMETEYICIAAQDGDEPVGVIVTDMEDNGDLNLLSIWTDQRCRRQGVATALLKKMTYVAFRLYDWDDTQYGDDIIIKAMYSLSDNFREPFEAWLKKNDFTDFAIMDEGEGDKPAICGATAEVHFYRADENGEGNPS